MKANVLKAFCHVEFHENFCFRALRGKAKGVKTRHTHERFKDHVIVREAGVVLEAEVVDNTMEAEFTRDGKAGEGRHSHTVNREDGIPGERPEEPLAVHEVECLLKKTNCNGCFHGGERAGVRWEGANVRRGVPP